MGLPTSSWQDLAGWNPQNPAIANNPAAPATTGNSAYGNPDDPSYGSFTQPFDIHAFLSYLDPGYGFQKQQGEQAVLNSAAAGSGALSGAAMKDLLSFNEGLAATGYQNAFDRYQTQQNNIFQRLYSIAGLGQNAAANVGNQGTQLAGNAGQMYSNAGSAAGAGIVGAGNALGGGLTDYWLLSHPELFGGAGGGSGGGTYGGSNGSGSFYTWP